MHTRQNVSTKPELGDFKLFVLQTKNGDPIDPKKGSDDRLQMAPWCSPSIVEEDEVALKLASYVCCFKMAQGNQTKDIFPTDDYELILTFNAGSAPALKEGTGRGVDVAGGAYAMTTVPPVAADESAV